LSTFRSFTTPKELLHLIITRWNLPEPKDKTPEGVEKYNTELKSPIRLRVFNLLKTWLNFILMILQILEFFIGNLWNLFIYLMVL